MKTLDALRDLPPGQCYILSAPRFEMVMTGVADARISKEGVIRLVYSDGFVERGLASDDILSTDMDNHSLLTWTGCVQDQRAATASRTADVGKQ